MTPAPLAVESGALLVTLIELCRGWPERGARLVGEPLVAAARHVATDAALAVSHRDVRAEALTRVDHALVAVRVLINTANAVDLLDTARAQALAETVATLGRMTGGWRKQLRRAAGGRTG